MKFHYIKKEHWARTPYFEHYFNQIRCTFSMTADIEIGLLRTELKRKGYKLYPALIYMLATVVNRHPEFRTCFDGEGRLGVWESMSPGFTIFHDANQTFSSIWAPYSADFAAFHEKYLSQTERFKHAGTLFPDPGAPPNTFPVSSIPWVSFTGFNLNIHSDGTYLLPIFTIGKYAERDKKVELPLAVQLHHTVCDGYHAGLLFAELQDMADGCAEWLRD